jgi:hypothetical protein
VIFRSRGGDALQRAVRSAIARKGDRAGEESQTIDCRITAIAADDLFQHLDHRLGMRRSSGAAPILVPA